MRIRTQIFFALLFTAAVGFGFLLHWIVDDLEPQYRESTEEPLVDASRVLATLAAKTARNGQIDVELFREAFTEVLHQSFSARIYNFTKTNVDFRVYITDALGRVVFDSNGGRDEGKDYSEWRDVRLTLNGEYGARTSRDTANDPNTSVMYVAAPILQNDQLIGVLSLGKPTKNANRFVAEAEKKILVGAVVGGLLVVLMGLVVSARLTRPVQYLTDHARAIRDGQRSALVKLGSGEVAELGEAFEEMRERLEGKQYVENYVQTLTHEVKSPLSAIQGAAELLREDMPVEQQRRFLSNIRSEVDRIKAIIEKLLLLSSLENQATLEQPEEIQLAELLEEIIESLRPVSQARGVKVELQIAEDCSILGERFSVRQAIYNLVLNAIEFSPMDSSVELTLSRENRLAKIEIVDRGPGIPEYARERVFERFYSLKRPDTGKKSSGLGLSLVKEVVEIHQGSIELENGSEGGVQARVVFPIGSSD